MSTSDCDCPECQTHMHERRKRPAPLGKGRFDWISSVLKLDERNHLSSLGLDAIMFLRFIKYCLTYFGGLFIVAIFLCVFNAYLPQMTGKSGYVETQLGYLTMQNMNAESSLIYVYTVLSWLFSLFAYWLLYRTWEDFVDLRKEHFATAEYQQAYHNRTIFLAMLPPKMRTNEAVASFLEKLEISAPFEQIMMGRDYGKLPELVKTHTEMNRKMESTIKAYYDKTERPMHRKSFMSKEKVDSMAFFSDKLHEFEEKIYTMRSVSDDRYTVNASALVSFPSTKAAADVIHLTQNKSYYCKKTGQLFTPSVKPCPPNEDIIWENLGLDEANVRTRRVLSYSIVAAITLLWTIIVAIVTSLTELSTIAKASPALADSLSRSAAGMLLLQSVIAPVLLVVLNMLVPIIFRKLTVMQGVRSHMGVERSVLGKYFVFQVYQVAAFIGASSVMNALIGGQSADPMTTLNEVINGFIKVKLSMLYVKSPYLTYHLNLIVLHLLHHCHGSWLHRFCN